MPLPYDRTTYDGKPMDWLTRAALEATAKRLGYPLSVTQGSYNAGRVSASAGTHDGGGVVDLPAFDHERKVLELRRTGFAAWYRPTIPGLWGEHIHAVLIGNRRLSDSAAQQVDEYIDGYDGLRGDGKDQGPRQFVGNRFRFPESLLPTIDLSRCREQFWRGINDEKLTAITGVRKIQRRLNARYSAGLKVDGIAGDITRAAWRKHERATDHVAGRVGVPDRDSLVNLMRGYARVVD